MSRTNPAPAQRRILAFEGGCNFRDLGGYQTRDGREIRWGKVYRTGVLSYFTERDHPSLRELGVTSICDLRRATERGREPTRWPDESAELLSFEDGGAPPSIQALSTPHPYTAAGMRATMLDLYRALPTWMVPRLRGLFARIAADNGSVIVHCAAGKDRTGIAIALLLKALDVPEDIILQDYLLTNTAGDFERFILERHNAELGLATTNHPILAMPADIRRVLFAADSDYLDAAFAQIARDYGDVATFLEQQIGIDREFKERLRRSLLSP